MKRQRARTGWSFDEGLKFDACTKFDQVTMIDRKMMWMMWVRDEDEDED